MTPPFELRAITDEEYPAWSRSVVLAFGHHASDAEIEDHRIAFERDRSLATFDGGEIVGTAGAFSFDLTLPGGTTTPVAGVTAVTVRATHHRRGILTAMMTAQLDDVAERGEALAILTASETLIYGRFGYGLATSYSAWRLRTEGARLARPAKVTGRLRLVDAVEAAKVVPGVYDAARHRHPGAVSRSERFWERWFHDREGDRDGASARFYVIHESASGGPDGYLAYRRKDGWDRGLPDGVLIVDELDATDDEVEAALWQFVLEADLVRTVQAHGRPVDEPLRWRLEDWRRLSVTNVADHLWARVLDVPAALGARRYGCDDALVLDVVDAFRPATEGRYRVEGGLDGAACARTTAEPDLALGVADLGALCLGGVQASVLGRAGRIEERTPGALRRADAFLASSPAPWCVTQF